MTQGITTYSTTTDSTRLSDGFSNFARTRQKPSSIHKNSWAICFSSKRLIMGYGSFFHHGAHCSTASLPPAMWELVGFAAAGQGGFVHYGLPARYSVGLTPISRRKTREK